MTTIFRTVFASGEAAEADVAYQLAERSLWAQIDERYPGGVLAHLEHSTSARQRIQLGLDVEEWEMKHVEVSTVVVTLLATIQTRKEGTKK